MPPDRITTQRFNVFQSTKDAFSAFWAFRLLITICVVWFLGASIFVSVSNSEDVSGYVSNAMASVIVGSILYSWHPILVASFALGQLTELQFLRLLLTQHEKAALFYPNKRFLSWKEKLARSIGIIAGSGSAILMYSIYVLLLNTPEFGDRMHSMVAVHFGE